MCFTEGFMELEKEIKLLKALAILKHSNPVDMWNIFKCMLLDVSGILTTLQEKLYSLSQKVYLKLIIIHLDT